MDHIYCTYFDHNYLSRAVVMIESLRRFDTKTPIYVLALSDLCEEVLTKLALHNVEIISLAAMEQAYPELVTIRATRKLIEFYFTLTPFLPHYLFSQTAADRITYLDGDLYFFTSPEPLLHSLGDASVAITPHRFSIDYRTHAMYGLFNVAWITYRRCTEGLDCLNTYKAECTAWCYDRLEDDRFGDQKYLDAWPERYKSLKIIDHKGANLGIWNIRNYILRLKNNVVMVDDDPLVFYHFAGTRVMADGSVRIAANVRSGLGKRSDAVLLQYVTAPYQQRLEHEVRSLLQRFPSLAAAKSGVRYTLPEHEAGG
ncbi:MAG: hypothetical protein QOF91_3377 [Alphaproteobacteria bacterium]|jgi:hypothetical protein|nr:hypothetical protein [Alphaproteobacteria bacterium]